MTSARPTLLRTWLQLFRAPNLFTVPGDPLVGFLFANGWDVDGSLVLAITASLCLYAAGLLMNDLADEEEDRRDRPSRPLPSQAASRRHVWVVTALLCLAGLGALAATGQPLALAAGGSLIASVGVYNWGTKGIPVLGALNMGLCRSLSVLLGALVGPRSDYHYGIPAAACFGLYIAAVTNLARHETRAAVPVAARVLPALCVVATSIIGMLQAVQAPEKLPAVGLYALLMAVIGWLGYRLFTRPQPLPPLIGAHIRALLLLQAATCYLAEPTGFGRYAAAVLVCLWPISRWVGRWFYAS